MNKLNIKYIYELTDDDRKNLYISYKKIPETFRKSHKTFGDFLGYHCASNKFASSNLMGKGRYIFQLHETTTKLFILADICPISKYNKTLLYYINLIDKSKNILDKYGLNLKLKVYDEKKRKYIKDIKDTIKKR